MGYTEIRNGDSWQGACEDMVNAINDLGFHPGQIYSIDVHNNGPDEDCIISAHWHSDPVGKLNMRLRFDPFVR